MWPFKCKHQVYRYHGMGYGKLQYFGTDGIGRVHAAVYAECGRCGKEFHVVNIHVPKGEWPKPYKAKES